VPSDIDRPTSEDEVASAKSLIGAELDPAAATQLHPSVSSSYEPQFSELVSASHEQIAQTGKARSPKSGIDLARYEEPSAPSLTPGTSNSERRNGWSQALRQAYTSHAYLSSRQLNLSLLEKYGKNAWLVGNSQIEDELRTLEKELAETQRQVDETDQHRRRTQETVRGETEGLEDAWRSGIGRAIEAEVAGEGLRRDILEKSRARP